MAATGRGGTGDMPQDGVPLREHMEKLIADFRAHVDVRFNEADKRYEQRFAAQQEAMRSALAAANTASDKEETNAALWRSSANEWREAMNDRERQFLPRAEAAQIVKAIEERIADLKEYRDKSEGQGQGIGAVWAWVVAALGVLVGAAGWFRGH